MKNSSSVDVRIMTKKLGALRNERARFLVNVLVLHDDMVHCPQIADVQLGVLFARERHHQSDLIGEGDTHTK